MELQIGLPVELLIKLAVRFRRKVGWVRKGFVAVDLVEEDASSHQI